MNEISKISGSNINFIPMRFEELIPALESKKIDAIIAGMTVTEESYIGSLQYRLSTFLEVCDKSLVDYEFISKLYNILVED